MNYTIILRIAVILLGIFTSIVVYFYMIQPWLLEPLCLVNSNGCVRMGYYQYNNSALVNMRNSGLWIWYNGDRAFVFGQPVGQLCENPSQFQPAYSINTRTGAKEGYKCVMSLPEVQKFYTDRGVKMNYIVKRAPANFDVYGALNILNDEGIINLNL